MREGWRLVTWDVLLVEGILVGVVEVILFHVGLRGVFFFILFLFLLLFFFTKNIIKESVSLA